MREIPLSIGEPAPWFICRTRSNPRYAFDSVGGLTVVLCFFGAAADPVAAAVLREIMANRARFDEVNTCFFGVSVDPEDERTGRVADAVPGIRYFWDFDRSVSARYGASRADGGYRPVTYVLDPGLRVLEVLPMSGDPASHVSSLLRILDRLPAPAPSCPAQAQAPVLVLPRVFEPGLCAALVDHYKARGGKDSGFMHELNGKTVHAVDYQHKRRRDCEIDDEALRRACMVRIHDRLAPALHQAFQFRAALLERYIVACYDAAEGGYFRPHRDNTTRGTAHRRFAVSLFLNSGEYEGGLLRFPEFGPALYGAPVGGAVVFSCSLLHEATPVERGCRYMFLPFLYDEAAHRMREENLEFVAGASSREAPPPAGSG